MLSPFLIVGGCFKNCRGFIAPFHGKGDVCLYNAKLS